MTGSVYDFLSYKNAQQDAENNKEESFDDKERWGGYSHAEIYRDYGDGFKG